MSTVAKITLGTLFTIAASSALAYFIWFKPKHADTHVSNSVTSKKHDDHPASYLRLHQKALEAKDYAMENHFNEQRCFLIDMRIESGLKRFFVFNLEKDSIEASGLVTHGTGSSNGTEELSFSNVPNSNATSIGRYRVGKPYYGNFGLAYKLYGLDKTNNKAFDRFVVLHSHACVPVNEVSPAPICESWGCPTVAPAFLKILQKDIDHSPKPILLWIYY